MCRDPNYEDVLLPQLADEAIDENSNKKVAHKTCTRNGDMRILSHTQTNKQPRITTMKC